MKILITGGSGFIGGTIAKNLASNKALKITAIGRKRRPDFLKNQEIDYLQLDLCGKMPYLNFDVCIHCAGLADDNSNKTQLDLANVYATKNLINHLSSCYKFIFISSSSVYNFRKFPLAKEENASLKEKLSAYGKSKLEAEKIVKNAGFDCTYILRPRAVYGDLDQTLLPRILSKFKDGKITVPGNLNIQTSLTHVNNLVEAINHVIRKHSKGIKIYNISDTSSYLMRDVFIKIGKIKSKEVQIIQLPVPIVKCFVNCLTSLRITPSISNQAIDYLTQNSELNTVKINKELQLDLKYNLDDYLKTLSLTYMK